MGKGADRCDDAIWKNDKAEKNWKLILVDFGFARALTPFELEDKEEDFRRPTASRELPLDPDFDDIYGMKNNKSKNIDVSSRCLELSAIGCRQFAAPEILQGACE